jgi:hypothetical protein
VEFVVRAFPRNYSRHKTDHSEYIGKKVLDLPKAFATAVDREFDIEAVLAPAFKNFAIGSCQNDF